MKKPNRYKKNYNGLSVSKTIEQTFIDNEKLLRRFFDEFDGMDSSLFESHREFERLANNCIDFLETNINKTTLPLSVTAQVVTLLENAIQISRSRLEIINIISNLYLKQSEMNNQLLCANESINKNKRWTSDDDELLIDMICDDMSLNFISLVLHRTPSAITNRVSKLVGMERISQEVAGRFIGKINGQEVEPNINGTVIKTKKGK